MRVRIQALDQLKSNFPSLPNREQAWDDLHRLTNDENISVRSKVASALWSIFSQIPDKQQAWNDLQRLANDQDKDVRVYANHSLGRISIFKASQAEKEEDYKDELETAISFFEKASKESIRFNPSEFCLPFYRSFHTIIFKKEDSQEEIDKYLANAKNAVKGSKSKALLVEALKNLANALKEVQSLEKLDLETKKGELNFYKKYCDHAAELIVEAESTAPSVNQIQNLGKMGLEEKEEESTSYMQYDESYSQYCGRTVGLIRGSEETAPFAIAAMRKGLPILDRNLKDIIEEIQTKSKIICQASEGTPAKEIIYNVNKGVENWEIGDQEQMKRGIEDLLLVLKTKIPPIPENKEILNNIEKMRYEKDLTKQYEILLNTIQLIPQVHIKEKSAEEIEIPLSENMNFLFKMESGLIQLTVLSLTLYTVLQILGVTIGNVEWTCLIITISLLFLIYQKLKLERD